jgi:hypothetical protein
MYSGLGVGWCSYDASTVCLQASIQSKEMKISTLTFFLFHSNFLALLKVRILQIMKEGKPDVEQMFGSHRVLTPPSLSSRRREGRFHIKK